MKLILNGIDPDDWILGIRAAKFLLLSGDGGTAAVEYGEANPKCFYARRNKASITVWPSTAGQR